MALVLDTLLFDKRGRPHNLEEVAVVYDGQTEDELEAGDISADITVLKSDIADEIDTGVTDLNTTKTNFIAAMTSLVNATALSGGDKTTLIADITSAHSTVTFDSTTVKANIDVLVGALPDSTIIYKSDVLRVVRTEVDAAIAADVTNFPYQCVWCGSEGVYEARMDVGADPLDTDLVHCAPCDGFGRVKNQQSVIIIKPVDVTYDKP